MSECAICKSPVSPDATIANGNLVCAACDERITAYADRVSARLERMRARAEKATQDAEATVERARVMGSFIPFGQPVIGPRDRAYRERMNKTYSRGYAKMERAQQLERRADAAEKNRAISSDDPEAVLKLRDKIAHAEAQQAQAVAINKAIRKLIKPFKYDSTGVRRGTVEQMNAAHNAQVEARRAYEATYAQHAPALAEMTGVTLEQAHKLLTPDFMGRIGIPDYTTKNNSANIRNMKARLAELERKAEKAAAQPEPTAETVAGVRLERDAVENRLRLHFPGKPDAATIADLKSRGFRWSPSNMAWQRQLTRDAEYAASGILERYSARA